MHTTYAKNKANPPRSSWRRETTLENTDGTVEVTKSWVEKEIHCSRRRVGSKQVVSHDFKSRKTYMEVGKQKVIE